MTLPTAAVAWVEAETQGRVLAAEPVAGATTVEIHRVTVDGGRHPGVLVVRRYAMAGYLAEWPGRPAHEAEVLSILADGPVPAPVPVAADSTGRHCDVPAVLMTAVNGAVDLERAASTTGCRDLATVAAALHTLDFVVERRYRPYRTGHPTVVPPWATDPGLWREAAGMTLPAAPAVLIHRDFHPGNVLWSDGRIGGVVDWGEACMGPPGVDVAHCRVNLALVSDADAPDRFAASYEAKTDSRHDRRWDVAVALDLLPHHGGEAEVAAWPRGGFPHGSRRRLEVFLAAALRAS